MKGCDSGWWKVNEIMYVCSAIKMVKEKNLKINLCLFQLWVTGKISDCSQTVSLYSICLNKAGKKVIQYLAIKLFSYWIQLRIFIQNTSTSCDGFLTVSFHSFCGTYVGHRTVFRIADDSPEVEFRCSSRNSAQPFQASYSSYNISQRKESRTRAWLIAARMQYRSWLIVGVSLYNTCLWMWVNDFVLKQILCLPIFRYLWTFGSST